jgi:diguanylate cyclase (GGDEF)-like protein/PAS domain S-box-containing protein
MNTLPIEFYENLLNNLHEGLYSVDTDMRITYWNEAAEKITGFTSKEVLGHQCSDNILRHVDENGVNLCENGCPLHTTLCDRVKREADLFLHHKEGYRVPVSVRTSFITNASGEITHGIELFTDLRAKEITELRIKELERMALLDTLTQLANREFLTREIAARFLEYQKYKIAFGLIFIDIDHFKVFNDTYGHNIGDKVLQMVSSTLEGATRPFDLIGRWGGEEFIGIVRNIDTQFLQDFSEHIRMLIESAFIVENGKRLNCTVSIGSTMVLSEDTAEKLIGRADTLMYESKTSGRNRVTIR